MQAQSLLIKSSPPQSSKKTIRDHRVDALRGAALLMMLADHVPDDLINRFTIRNFGFADAAEIFVLLAGYASFLAYGRLIDTKGWISGIKRILGRCFKLYLYQTGMTFIFIWTVRHWRHYQPLPEYIIEPQLAHGYDWIWRIFTFDALPSYLNILPLYVVLLALFPLIYFLLKKNIFILASSSIIIWSIANIDPHLTIPNWLDPNGWYLNPFGWQLLYVIGVLGALWASKNNGDLPSNRLLKISCSAYLIGSFIICFPYEYWHLGSLHFFPSPPNTGKSTLAPWRLIDIMSIFYLVQSSQLMKKIATNKIGQMLSMLGRNSLEVFSFGSVLDLIGRLIFAGFGNSFLIQILLNLFGLTLTFALAIPLDRTRQKAKAARSVQYVHEAINRPG